MFDFAFMQRAFFVGVFLSVMIPLIGVVMVSRKTSMLGDAMSHISLSGVAIGLILGYNPVLGAVIVCILAGLSIDKIRKRFPDYGDMATAIITSIGLALAAVLSDFTPGGTSLESYLFGSISSITWFDVILAGGLFVLVIFFNVLFYGALVNFAIDEKLSRLYGISAVNITRVYTILAAMTIALASKMIGALIVTSLIILPVATALFIARSYKATVLYSILFGNIYMICGLGISYHVEISPGGAVVFTALVTMFLLALYRRVKLKKASA